MNARFVNAPFACGRGCLSTLPEVSGKRVALFIDSRALGRERLKAVTSGLEQAGIAWQLVADIGGEPSIHDALRPLDEMAVFKPDTIVAIGGGSVLDTAKASWVFYEHPGIGLEKAFTPFAIPGLGDKARLIAAPTTSGAGSETTCVAVLIDPDTRTKRLMMSSELVPDLAILDADLVDSMPAKVAAYSGLDALSHALEAATCTVSSGLVVSVAVQAALEVFGWLPISVRSRPGEGEFHVRLKRQALTDTHSSRALIARSMQASPQVRLCSAPSV
ncbi:MAG: iron-containing alcohol dehydrogenase [Clostridia bacterium]|nr:iron-containing alcohol dehydrogenase [Clostridia bacterium]